MVKQMSLQLKHYPKKIDPNKFVAIPKMQNFLLLSNFGKEKMAKICKKKGTD